MDVYEAIRRMREKSEKRECFSFSFMSYSYERGKSEGIVEIQNARLRKQSTKEKNRFADLCSTLLIWILWNTACAIKCYY